MTLDTLAKIATIVAGIGTFGATTMTLVTSKPVSAASEDSLARQLADGRPWSLAAAGGRSAILTLNPDGSGTIKGPPIPISPSWRETPAGMCLNLGPAGERCVTLRRIDNGFEGYKDGMLELRMTR